MLQVTKLHSKFDELQLKHGDQNLTSIYGAGEINSPNIMFIFMNPTARNISSQRNWKGIKAPWLGTKQVWGMLNELGLIDDKLFQNVTKFKPTDWTNDFSVELYENLKINSVYLTNLAKCTQIDARPLTNNIYTEYLELMYEEIKTINPQKIVTFGNQVSEVLLNKPVSVSKYLEDEYEILKLSKEYNVYPTYYPVRQGRRNQPMAVKRIKSILKTEVFI